MKKYSYSFDGESYCGTFSTEQEAIDAAIYDRENEDAVSPFWIGEQVNYAASSFVDVDSLLEQTGENAQCEGGEWAEEYPLLTKEEAEELGEMICNFIDAKSPVTFFGIRGHVKYQLIHGEIVECEEETK